MVEKIRMKISRNLNKRGLVRNGRGQIKISFSMIFSIFLIVVFLAVAFYAIKTFFNFQDSAEVGIFINDLQTDVDRIWRSTESSQTREYNLPDEISKVCFVDFGEGVGSSGDFAHLYNELKFYDVGERNMMFYPPEASDTEGTNIENINVEETTRFDNPFCLDVSQGKLELTLVKNFGEARVRVERIS